MKEFEEHAISKFPHGRDCPSTVFYSGKHRVGLLPIFSILDNGALGYVARGYCLECSKEFKNTDVFIVKQNNEHKKDITTSV